MPRKPKTESDAKTAAPAAPAKPATPSLAAVEAARRRGGREKGRVFLVDAMSYIFRAYHAMARQRPMSTRTGIPTAATFVFVNMLRKLRDDFDPEYLAAIFDPAGPTFRDEHAARVASIRKFDLKTQSFFEVDHKGYKAERAPTPPDLSQQIPYIRRALEAFRIPILEVPRFEADDVLGTLARQGAELGHPVYVVSNDKDMLQLVGDRICVLNPPKDNLVCDRAKVEELLGVPPERVVDVMALRGDAVDGVPGAPGIGDKGSVELIQRFGTVEAALEHAAEVERKTYRESLQNSRDQVLYSKLMVTLDTQVPITLDLEGMRSREADATAAHALFTELEFNTLAQEYAPAAEPEATEYGEAKTAADVEAVLRGVTNEHPLAIAVEVPEPETTEPEEDEAEEESGSLALTPVAPAAAPRCENVAISVEPGKALNVRLGSNPGAERLQQALADSTVPKVVHDLKSALRALDACGVTVADPALDSMLYSYLLDPTYGSHTLPAVALRRLHRKLSGSLSEAADVTGPLASELGRELNADLRKVYEEIDRPLVPVLARMEAAGVKIDRAALSAMSAQLERDASEKAKAIYEQAGTEFNINSPRQLGDVLFNKLNLPKPVKYGKGRTISTAQDVLEELAKQHAVPRLVIEYRQLAKLKSTYVDTLPAMLDPSTGRLHTTFNQAATATGRLSSVNPNLQNIPIRTELGREIRAAFIAEPGNVLLAADYSQIELRLLAHFSEDKLLTEAYRRGDDIHTLTAAEVFGIPPMVIDAEHRRRAKVVNFGIVYGLSAFGLAQQLGIDQKDAKRYIDAYFAQYSGVREWRERILEQARAEQKVRTLFGRVRPIPDILSKNFTARGFAERTAINTPLQGTAADLIKIAMIRLDAEIRRRGLRSQMTLQVHDELVFEVPEAEVDAMRALVKEHMEGAHPLRVPLEVEMGVGKNWRDLE